MSECFIDTKGLDYSEYKQLLKELGNSFPNIYFLDVAMGDRILTLTRQEVNYILNFNAEEYVKDVKLTHRLRELKDWFEKTPPEKESILSDDMDRFFENCVKQTNGLMESNVQDNPWSITKKDVMKYNEYTKYSLYDIELQSVFEEKPVYRTFISKIFHSKIGIQGTAMTHYDLAPLNNGIERSKYNEKYFWYDRKKKNMKNLKHYAICVKVLNEKAKNYNLIPKPPLNSKFGIAGWHFDFDKPQWYLDLKLEPGDDKDNLILKANPVKSEPIKEYDFFSRTSTYSTPKWFFKMRGVRWNVVKATTLFLQSQKYNPKHKTWLKIYPHAISDVFSTIKNHGARAVNKRLLTPKTYTPLLAGFMENDTYTTTLITWDAHARCMFKDKDTKTLYVFDPWMQKVSGNFYDEITKIAKQKYGYVTVFTKRTEEQDNEGSCMILSYIRMLLLAEYGFTGATMNVDDVYPVMVKRLFCKMADFSDVGRIKEECNRITTN